jgi:hypothetical protein
MSWMRGKRCSSKGGDRLGAYRHKTAVFSEGLSPSTEAPKRPPSGSRLSGNPICRVNSLSTSCRVTSGPAI